MSINLNEHRPSIRYKAPAVKAGQGRADYESEVSVLVLLVALSVAGLAWLAWMSFQ